jgi:hypothetical protein
MNLILRAMGPGLQPFSFLRVTTVAIPEVTTGSGESGTANFLGDEC